MPSNDWPPSPPLAAPLQLAVPGRLEALEPARQAVFDHLAPCALGPRVIFAIELILEEVLMNAVLHAFGDDAREHLIELRVQLQPDAVVLQFADDGMPFDPTRATEPEMPASIAEAVPGGRGVLLVRRFARALHYQRSNGHNLLTVEVAHERS
jgi:anti-sigma regulatory factor (Ser/Thr protein kinase)